MLVTFFVVICLLPTELLQEGLGDICPKIVRVYAETLEYEDFPIPRDTYRVGRMAKRTDESLRNVSLHHLIRQPGNPNSTVIKMFDDYFHKNEETPWNVTDEEIETYTKLIGAAVAEELPKYDIILCTCTAAAANDIKSGAKIAQCIIDECGMCTEPESLIPLVKHNPEQVILIGDHKQLAPVVVEKRAKKLGLNVSLFERYSDRAIMLDTQYRMVSWEYMKCLEKSNTYEAQSSVYKVNL